MHIQATYEAGISCRVDKKGKRALLCLSRAYFLKDTDCTAESLHMQVTTYGEEGGLETCVIRMKHESLEAIEKAYMRISRIFKATGSFEN